MRVGELRWRHGTIIAQAADAGYGRDVLSRWQGGFAAVVVTLLACALVIGDLADTGMRRWWVGHALTTDTVAGLLVLLITVLVVDQVVSLRQFNDRARAVAAQAAIIMSQAMRAAHEVSQAVAQGLGPGQRDAASDEFRTYMIMLLVGAPVLIDAKVSRDFLEQAQALAGEMARALGATAKAPSPASISDARLEHAVQRLRAASTPLLQVLDPETRVAVRGEDPALPPPVPDMPGGSVRSRSHYAKDPIGSPRGRLGCRRLRGAMYGWE